MAFSLQGYHTGHWIHQKALHFFFYYYTRLDGFHFVQGQRFHHSQEEQRREHHQRDMGDIRFNGLPLLIGATGFGHYWFEWHRIPPDDKVDSSPKTERGPDSRSPKTIEKHSKHFTLTLALQNRPLPYRDRPAALCRSAGYLSSQRALTPSSDRYPYQRPEFRDIGGSV